MSANKKKVAIVGCAESKNLTPFQNQEFEIWGVNNLFMQNDLPNARWDRWFEIHPIEFDGKDFLRRKLIKPGIYEWSKEFRGMTINNYIKGLGDLKIPVYMQKQWEQIPNSVVFPLPDIINKFGRYFTNTVSYEIALAIMEGFEEIHVYGVDMAIGSEYQAQRPSCEYFLGLAAGLGRKIYIPPTADLLKTRFMYGFEEREMCEWEKKVSAMRASIKHRKVETENEIKFKTNQFHQYIGAETAIDEIDKIWG